jgi:hypothetical protein
MVRDAFMRQILSVFVALALAVPAAAQQPIIFDVSNVVMGAQKTPTLWLFAEGKWSDAGEHVGPGSTHIQCYKSFGFCDVANAFETFGEAGVNLTSFDILRWDSKEIIAVDSSPICIANTLRVDLISKRVTLSSSDKGVKADSCKGLDKLPTAVLWGMDDITKDAINRAKSKQQNH